LPKYTPLERDEADWERHASRVSQWNRHRKWRLFEREVVPDPRLRLLDVGFSEEEFRVTDNFIEKHYPYPERITALGIDTPRLFSQRYPDVGVVTYDGSMFPFADKSFDLVWSNAVLEHVGGRDEQLHFLQEVKRVGKRAFLTTPNKYFPIEVHTRTPLMHWLPTPVFEAYLRFVGKHWAAGDYMNLLSERDLRSLLGTAGYQNFRLVKNRFGGFVLDFVVLVTF
jgi:SAM-dependent methyltransferase